MTYADEPSSDDGLRDARPATTLWRKGFWLAILLACVMALPCLGFGFFFDDFLQFLTLSGADQRAAPLDLFNLVDGHPATMRSQMDNGAQPWFTYPGLKIHFFRPLTSAAMVLDYWLFGRNPLGYHLHSIVWYLALLGAAALLFKRSLPGALGLLTFFVFVADDAHWLPVAWWSHRNAIVAAAPALLGVVAHIRWREEAWKPGLPLSLLGYGLGLLGGEVALGAMAYLAAYELAGSSDAWRRRATALVPGSALLLIYVGFYAHYGLGTEGSDLYINPLATPLHYLQEMPRRILLLTGAHFFSVPPELHMVFPAWSPLLTALCFVTVALTAFALAGLWRGIKAEERRGVRWLLLGAALSCLPVAATFPTSRLLLLPSLGGAAGIALLIRHAWRLRPGGAKTPRLHVYEPAKRARAFSLLRCALVVGWIFVVMHLVISPLLWPIQTYCIRLINGPGEAAIASVAVDPARAAEQKVVVLNATDFTTSFYASAVRAHQNLPRPSAWWTLTVDPHAHRLHRTGPKRFELEVIDGEMLTTGIEQNLRGGEYPMRLGQVVQVDGFRAEVLEMGAHGPTRVSFSFEAPLDDPRYIFLLGRGTALETVEMPPVGKNILLPPA